jgi:hypothetical protein
MSKWYATLEKLAAMGNPGPMLSKNFLAIPQGKIIPREVKPFAAIVRPDRADARPDFLTFHRI